MAASELATMLLTARSLPLTVGVFGPWGSGKTSMLGLTESALGGNDLVVTVWFNAWKYENREEVWPAFVQAVVARLADLSPASSVREKVLSFGRAAGKVFAGRTLQMLTQNLVSADDFDKVVEQYSGMQSDRAELINGFDRAFEALLDDVLGSRTLVILIDDLDRCSPRSALSVLEGVKLFLGAARCAFVVALDMDSLLASLDVLKDHDLDYRLNYLEKLIQVARYVPPPSNAKLRGALQEMTGLELSDALWHLVSTAAEANPRRAKRFVNTLQLATVARSGNGDGPDIVAVARIMVLRVRFPEFFLRVTLDDQLWCDAERHLAGELCGDESRIDVVASVLEDERLRRFLVETGPNSRLFYPPAPSGIELRRALEDSGQFSYGYMNSGRKQR